MIPAGGFPYEQKAIRIPEENNERIVRFDVMTS